MPIRAPLYGLACVICFSIVTKAYAEPEPPDQNVEQTGSQIPEGGLQLTLPSFNVISANKPLKLDLKPLKQNKKAAAYQILEILAPRPNQTVFINTANLGIKIKLLPSIKTDQGHKLQILLNDEVLTENKLSYMLDNADPGRHRVSARVIDEAGNTVINTKPVTINIEKSVAQGF